MHWGTFNTHMHTPRTFPKGYTLSYPNRQHDSDVLKIVTLTRHWEVLNVLKIVTLIHVWLVRYDIPQCLLEGGIIVFVYTLDCHGLQHSDNLEPYL